MHHSLISELLLRPFKTLFFEYSVTMILDKNPDWLYNGRICYDLSAQSVQRTSGFRQFVHVAHQNGI